MNRRRRSTLLLLPTDWTPEQALAVHDFLTDLSEVIWQHYEEPMIELLQGETGQGDTPPEPIDFDTIPF